MIITVTQKHIDEGLIADCSRCPVALAIREVFPYVDEILIRSTDVWLGKGENLIVKELPIGVRFFIRNFDNDKDVKPFSFELTL